MIRYDEPVFRPPSEAYSLIVQATIGCSHNRCAFCEMYASKKFRARPLDEILAEIDEFAPVADKINKVFLADGNPLALSNKKLLPILDKLEKTFPKLRRVSAYALPGDALRKSDSELLELREAGLSLLYVGIETGSDDLLRQIDKGETAETTVRGLNKARNAGIDLSVMIINGLGGQSRIRDHAERSAEVVNRIQPRYLSTLVLSFPYGIERFRERFLGEFEPCEIEALLLEQRIFLENLELDQTVFRSDHASNFLILKGILNRDKDKFLQRLDSALDNPDSAGLRPEFLRGL